jgi:hypothetical protein
MIRRLLALLPVPGCVAAVTAGFYLHQAVGWGLIAVSCFVLEWRYDRD